MRSVLLITSGAYANAELTSDFGLQPTAFLPIGHKRLVEYQIELATSLKCEKYISLPDNYNLVDRDVTLLDSNNVITFRTDPNITLSESLLKFIEEIEPDEYTKLYVLHGDTLFKSLTSNTDVLYYGLTNMFYKWGDLNEIIGNVNKNRFSHQAVLSGYFTFSNIALFKSMLKEHRSFELALKGYNKICSFKTVHEKDWLDFGHSNLYYKSKMKLNVTRSFNKAEAHTNFIKKISKNKNKMNSEYFWFKQLPEELSLFTPSVWGYKENSDEASYNIEFVGAPTLQEKWVFGNLPSYVYYPILEQIFEFIKQSKNLKYSEIDTKTANRLLKEIYISKTKLRINQFVNELKFDSDSEITINGEKFPSLNHFTNEVLSILERELNDNIEESYLTIMHGDLCFSNILYDSRSSLIKLIDPRGGINEDFNSGIKIIGDFKYDIAKLGHSLIGNYDYIVTGFYDLSLDMKNYVFKFKLHNKNSNELKDYFYNEVEKLNVNSSFIKSSITNLFISMLPLHKEDRERQIALLLNAYRFYYKE